MFSPAHQQSFSLTPTVKQNSFKKGFYMSKNYLSKGSGAIKVLPSQNLTQQIVEEKGKDDKKSPPKSNIKSNILRKQLRSPNLLDNNLLARSKTEGSIYENIAKRFSLRKLANQQQQVEKIRKSISHHEQDKTQATRERIKNIIDVYSQKKQSTQIKLVNLSTSNQISSTMVTNPSDYRGKCKGTDQEEALEKVLQRVRNMCIIFKQREKRYQQTELELRSEIQRLNLIISKQHSLLSTKPKFK